MRSDYRGNQCVTKLVSLIHAIINLNSSCHTLVLLDHRIWSGGSRAWPMGASLLNRRKVMWPPAFGTKSWDRERNLANTKGEKAFCLLDKICRYGQMRECKAWLGWAGSTQHHLGTCFRLTPAATPTVSSHATET